MVYNLASENSSTAEREVADRKKSLGSALKHNLYNKGSFCVYLYKFVRFWFILL